VGTSQEPSAQEFFFSTFGFSIFQIAFTVDRLGLPDLLDGAPKTSDEIAATLGVDPEYLSRLLRAAVGVGVLTSTDGRFGLTPLGQMYRSDSIANVKKMTELSASKPVWQAWGALEDAIRTGKPAFDCAHGIGFYEYIKTDLDLAGLFHAAMASSTEAQVPSLVKGYDFGDANNVFDVGGGNGTHLAAILAANPKLRGTVADTAVALRDAPEVFRKAGVSDRAGGVPTDFFESVPTGGDVYMLKNVLIDFDDEMATTILRNTRAALGDKGKILIVALPMPEAVADHGGTDSGLISAIVDIATMVCTTGKERTVAEYEKLFAGVGLELGNVTEIAAGTIRHRLIEAVPAR
jgi:hypothetical protein